MKLSRLLIAELKYRPVPSMLACLAVWIAAACVSASLIILADFDLQTDSEIHALQERAQARMASLENEARIFAKSLGFNIFVYNSKQDLGKFYTNDTSDHFLTMQQANKLAESDFEFLNHLLPILREKYFWKEQSMPVIIGGIQGEIYIKQQWQEPMEVELIPGEVHLGHSIASELNIQQGDSVEIEGSSFTVTNVRQRLGTKDDITLFMNLGDAQQLLDRPEQISGILALSCNCEAGEIEPIRKGVKEIIPGTDVVEFTIRAQARAQARKVIAETASQELDDIMTSRSQIRATLSSLSLLLSGIMTIVCVFLLVFLYGGNVRERKSEVAILSALGVERASIHSLFLAKALILAFTGSICGCVMGLAIALALSNQAGSMPLGSLLIPSTGIILTACFLSLLAYWWPIRLAASRDPGLVLNEN
ncbi:MAG: ABC transporter permease [Puniceicoccaceae bacterium]